MPQAAFDIRIRALPTNSDALRCVLLPHVHELPAAGAPVGTPVQDHPWATATGHQAPLPGTPPKEHPNGLWLPPAHAVLEFLDSTPLAGLGAKFQLLWLDLEPGQNEPGEGNPPADGLLQPRFRSGGAEPRITCFAGMRSLLEEEDGRASVISARNTKEFLLFLIEAFRFDGTLEEFARIGNAEMLACLSHFVFEIHSLTASEKEAVQRVNDWKTNGRVRVTYPDDPALLQQEQTNVPGPAEVPFLITQAMEPSDDDPAELISILPVQRADGVYFRLDKPADLKDYPAEELKLLLHRSEGDIPLEDPPVVATSLYDFQKFVPNPKSDLATAEPEDREQVPITERWFHIADRFAPGKFVGRQLHYRLDVIDGFGIIRATSAVTLLRHHFDPPPQPGKAQVTLHMGPPVRLVLEAEYAPAALSEAAFPRNEADAAGAARWQQALLDEYDVSVFFQERPLDECGFYGDDDDFALMEGLRQADALYDPRTADSTRSPIAGHPMEDHLRGRYDHAGLQPAPAPLDHTAVAPHWQPVWEKKKGDPEGAKPQELARLQLTWTLPADKGGWLEQFRGYQFYVGLRRRRHQSEVNVRAPLSQCEHRLAYDPPTGESVVIGVFQLEFFPFDPSPKMGLTQQFLHRDCFRLALLQRREDLEEPGGVAFYPLADTQDLREGAWESPAKGDGPVVVELDFTHPAANHPDSRGTIVDSDGTVKDDAPALPVGGVRILVRDPVAEADHSPFLTAEAVQVLPREVARYRPVSIEQGLAVRPLNADPALRSTAAPPATVAGSKMEETEELVRCFGPGGVVAQLRAQLRVAVGTIQTTVVDGSGAPIFRERSFHADAWDSPDGGETLSGAFDALQAEIDDLKIRLDGLKKRLGEQGVAQTEKDTLEQIDLKTAEMHKAITGRMQPWLAKARKSLEVDLSELKDQKPPAVEPPVDWEVTTDLAAAWWPANGRLSGLMRELGLAQDLVVQLGAINTARTHVKDAAAALGAGSPLKVLSVETVDGDTMATIRLVVMPWAARPAVPAGPGPAVTARPALLQSILGDSGPWLKLYNHCVVGPRLLRYRDNTRAPLNLSLRSGRRVRYRWRGLRDLWRHNLEFAVQLLDRYERIRERFLLEQQRKVAEAVTEAPDAAAGAVAGADNEKIELLAADRRARSRDLLGDTLTFASAAARDLAVHRIRVPRLEPIGLPPGIFPAALRQPWQVAFEVLDTDERQKTAHNALARTRPGDLQLHLPIRSFFPDAPAYFPSAGEPKHEGAIAHLRKVALAQGVPFFKWWAGQLASAGKKMTDQTQYDLPSGLGKTATRVKEDKFLSWTIGGRTPVPDEGFAPPRPGCDTVAYPDEAYYLQYEQGCYFSADDRVSREVRANVEREPWHLALPFPAKYEFRPGTRDLQILLSPALLGSHCTLEEIKRSLGVDQAWRLQPDDPRGLTLKEFGAPAEGDWAIPLAALPDVWLEYAFYLNVAEGDAGQKLVPLFEWKAPRRDGGLGPLTEDANHPLGFEIKSLARALLTGDPSARWLVADAATGAAVVEIVAKFSDDQAEAFAALAARPQNRLHLALRRKSLSTAFLNLS